MVDLPRTPKLTVEYSWDGTGNYDGSHDNAIRDTAADTGWQIESGKDGARSLNPPMVSRSGGELRNDHARYSTDNPASPIYQLVLPGRPSRVTAKHGVRRLYRAAISYRDHIPYRGRALYYLHTGQISAIGQQTAVGAQRAKIASLGGLNKLIGQRVTVALQENIRTDQAVALLLDAAGWPSDRRAISTGDTLMTYWWCDERSPWEALVELLATEGPGSIWEDGKGYLHFENRGFRTTNPDSNTSRATFSDRAYSRVLYRAHVPYREHRLYRGRGSGLSYTSLNFEPGFDNVYNRATYTTRQRSVAALAAVWTYSPTISLGSGQSNTLIARPSDPFKDAVTPTSPTDFTVSGGTVSVSMTATSGFVAFIRFTATSGTPTITGLQLRAKALAVASETVAQSTLDTAASVAKYGLTRTLSVGGWPEVDVSQAEAVCDAWVSRYQFHRPQVTITVENDSAEALRMILDLNVSDRITLIDTNSGLSGDVWIESKQLAITGQGGRLVRATFGCEKVEEIEGAVWDTAVWDTAVWGR